MMVKGKCCKLFIQKISTNPKETQDQSFLFGFFGRRMKDQTLLSHAITHLMFTPRNTDCRKEQDADNSGQCRSVQILMQAEPDSPHCSSKALAALPSGQPCGNTSSNAILANKNHTFVHKFYCFKRIHFTSVCFAKFPLTCSTCHSQGKSVSESVCVRHTHHD